MLELCGLQWEVPFSFFLSFLLLFFFFNQKVILNPKWGVTKSHTPQISRATPSCGERASKVLNSYCSLPSPTTPREGQLIPFILCWAESPKGKTLPSGLWQPLGQQAYNLCLSNLHTCATHLDTWLKCRFWFCRSGVGLRSCSSNSLPDETLGQQGFETQVAVSSENPAGKALHFEFALLPYFK